MRVAWVARRKRNGGPTTTEDSGEARSGLGSRGESTLRVPVSACIDTSFSTLMKYQPCPAAGSAPPCKWAQCAPAFDSSLRVSCWSPAETMPILLYQYVNSCLFFFFWLCTIYDNAFNCNYWTFRLFSGFGYYKQHCTE